MFNELFHELMIGFCGGVFALGFYELTEKFWLKFLSSSFDKDNDSDKKSQ